MSNKPFHYQAPFPLKKDDTEYYLLTSEHVSVSEFEGQEILKVAPEALTLLARQAFHDASFMLRPAHQQQVADILRDPEASENDKYVALQFLRNSDIAAKGVLPTCQDTGTAIIVGKKGQRVWTGGCDEAALARGVYNTYIEDNLRYSQNAPLDMYKEVNTGTNLPAQIDLYAVDGDEYKFLCIAKGGGSANWTGDVTPEDKCHCCQFPAPLRPHVVWFGEMPLGMDEIYMALSMADIFIAIGTSGHVYPAAGFVHEAKLHGAHTVELNLEPSQVGNEFAEKYYGPASQVVPEFVEKLLKGL